jgi:hypothetical protein
MALNLYDKKQLKKEADKEIIASHSFNPNKPKTVDWQKVLEIVANRIELDKLSKKKNVSASKKVSQ